MSIDPKRLETDAKRLGAEHKAQRPTTRTGATDAITAALPAIEQLRDQGVEWAAIAAAMAAQGVVQGADRQPLTGRRLCALLSAIRKREERRARKRSLRRARTDVVPRYTPGMVTVAPELAPETHRRTASFSEGELRSEAFANLQSLLKEQK
jgi:hypothetical protein